LDVNGNDEAMQEGELTAGLTGQVVSITYDFQP
jgi:hypothetical protein